MAEFQLIKETCVSNYFRSEAVEIQILLIFFQTFNFLKKISLPVFVCQSVPVLDVCAVLSKSMKRKRTILTVPWLVEFLSMLDFIGPLLLCYRTALGTLLLLYRSGLSFLIHIQFAPNLLDKLWLTVCHFDWLSHYKAKAFLFLFGNVCFLFTLLGLFGKIWLFTLVGECCWAHVEKCVTLTSY